MARVISTAESRAKEDVPDWKKFELGRLEDVDGIILPGPNALPQDEARFGQNRLHSKRFQNQAQESAPPQPNPDRILPDDPAFTAMQKALSWAKETQHGQRHQQRWGRVAAALGADNGRDPMTFEEAEGLWERFGRNARWTMAINAIEDAEALTSTPAPMPAPPAPAAPAVRDPIEDANRYRAAVGLPPVEKSQGEKLREALLDANEREDVVVREFNPATGTLDEISVSPEEAHKREMETYPQPGRHAGQLHGRGMAPAHRHGPGCLLHRGAEATHHLRPRLRPPDMVAGRPRARRRKSGGMKARAGCPMWGSSRRRWPMKDWLTGPVAILLVMLLAGTLCQCAALPAL